MLSIFEMSSPGNAGLYKFISCHVSMLSLEEVTNYIYCALFFMQQFSLELKIYQKVKSWGQGLEKSYI